MKLLTRTIIVLCVVNLTAAIPASAMMAASENKTFTISGTTGLPGVSMTGLPGNPVTDQNGYYMAKVPSGFSGKVMPAREGYKFSPSFKEYSILTGDMTNQDYAPAVLTYTISGNARAGGTIMKGLPGNVVTDQRGYYSVTVPYGWTGTVEPVKKGYDFEPPGLIYKKVVNNFPRQDYAPAATPEPSDAASSGLYGSSGSSGSRSRSRVADPYSGSLGDSSGSRSRGRSTSGYRPAIRSGGRKVIVIPAGEVKAKELTETVEDMHVMSHILDERFKETRRIQGFFTDFGDFFGRDSRNTEATYLQGFGVLFLMEVNFAFSSPPEKPAQDPTETTEAVDSTWQEAKRQVFSPGGSSGMEEDDSGDGYDDEMVEQLKAELVRTLKHAGNVRNIDPNEWIILTVIGGQRQFGMGFDPDFPTGISTSRSRSSGHGAGSSGLMGDFGRYGGGIIVGGYGGMSGGMGGIYSEMSTYGGTTFSSSTVLTIRAKKSYVDDFAKGELDFEQFQKYVQIFMY